MKLMKLLVFVLALSLCAPAQVLSGPSLTASGTGIVIGNNSPNCTITTASLPGGVSGAAYSQSINTTNCVAPINWAITAGTILAGTSLTTPTAGTVGTISGTLGAAGAYSFTVQATDANGKVATQPYSATIVPACSISTTSLPNGTVGVAYSQTLVVANCVAPLTFSITSGSLPTGLGPIGTSTGTIAGTPTTPGTYSFTAHVVDNNGNAFSQPLSITINSGATCSISTLSLPNATQGSPYSQNISTANCTAPLTWGLAVGSGPLPTGLSLTTPTAGTTGTLSGNPTALGTFNFTVQVTDSGSNVAQQAYTVVVSAVSGDDNTFCTPSGTWIGPTTDGPANLPSACMNTALSNTPAPGITRGPDSTTATVQADINAAACGDKIQVLAGSSIGTINLPAKGCDNAHWIWIESTGVSNVNFPAEGVELTPCWSGVASLPNRPAYTCPSPQVLTFKMVTPASSNAIKSTSGDHYRIMGAEITRVATPGVPVYNLVDLSSSGTQTNNIIFDRTWFHGINQDGNFPLTVSTDTSTTRAIYLGQSNHIAAINSYFSDFYDTGSTSSNGNTDAQCIGGGSGSITNSNWGVYKFVNDHCEASGEGILLGGGGGPALTPVGCTPTVNCNKDVPSDIEVRRNYFFKPQSWNGNTTTVPLVGWPVVKNGFEMKVGLRALFEGNVIENTWYDAQVGYCWSTAPKNQSNGGSPNLPTDPTAMTWDFTYRYNYCYNVAYGIGLYQSMDAGCSTCEAWGANGVSEHDNVIDWVNLGNLTSQSAADEMEVFAAKDATNTGLNKLQNINISHNTFVRGVRALAIFGADSTGLLSSWTVQNNIWAYATYGFVDIGNTGGCDTPFDNTNNAYGILNACVTGYTFDHNAVFNWTGGTLGSKWPTNGSGAGNFFYTNTAGPGFTNYGTGNSNFNPANYELVPSSPLHNAGSDGKDIGADIPTMLTKISGVRQ